ncbi:hypothetical protein BS47DRAFT_1329986 [Hydnum rufescens UP504]|uniref:Uncharacterized protein n=1 Tax=Hydnum rufescens UP504 TaxID=1448309 RepID=A0A9P6DS64_9AGAM|nr:hypothetical protein BS47DRAFT_1329986 [Hydnum rufescens UP504]
MPFFDLSLIFEPAKQKGKQPNEISSPERHSLEARIDALVHLGYTVIAINHVVQSKFQQPAPDFGLRKRDGVIILRRLTIVLDEASEKGFGLTNNNASSLASYDIISLLPTTQTSFSLACLTHSMPGPLTAHIISLDLSSQPRLPFYLKHTLIRTAIRNGAVFEIPYAPALSPNDEHKRRNWWANAREVARVTHGKSILLSGGGQTIADLRAPLDVANVATLLGIAQNLARDALSTTPKSLVLRAQTRKTYRAVLSEPKLMLPSSTQRFFLGLDTNRYVNCRASGDGSHVYGRTSRSSHFAAAYRK